jgi:hypothetical protein
MIEAIGSGFSPLVIELLLLAMCYSTARLMVKRFQMPD